MAPAIVLADDNPHALRMGTAYLADLGFSAATAADGAAAWAVIEREHPAVVLADAALPGVSGSELAQRIKATPATAHARVLLLVGALAPISDALRASADGVLRKPLSSAGLEPWLRDLPAATARGAAAPLTPAEMLERAIEAAARR